MAKELTMEILIDNFGRILIPQALRKNFGLRSGSVLEVEESGNKIILKPKEEQGCLKIKEKIAVYSGKIDNPSDLLRESRNKRIKKLSGI